MQINRFKTSFAEEEQTLLCYKCKEYKPISTFSKSKTTSKKRLGCQCFCKSCMADYRKTIPKELRSEQGKRSYYKLSSNPKTRLKRLLSASTSDRTELDFEWCWNRLEQNNFCCEITQHPFTWDTRSPTSLSIDRIDPLKGYTKDNIRFVCWWVNAAMGNWGLDTLINLIKEWNAD